MRPPFRRRYETTTVRREHGLRQERFSVKGVKSKGIIKGKESRTRAKRKQGEEAALQNANENRPGLWPIDGGVMHRRVVPHRLLPGVW